MISLPRLTPRVSRLLKDSRGYPVPWFVAWFEDGEPSPPGRGKPDFRVVAPGKIATAVGGGRCWICGDTLGAHRVYVIGPMCVVNRVTTEPPSHRECAEFAARACPFLTNPREKRNAKNLPEDGVVAGIRIDRNPGAVCLYETRAARPFRAGPGYLFELGKPERVDWWAQGRSATRAEIEESIRTGYPILREMAERDGPRAVKMLEAQRDAAMGLLPAA